jgi:hypothetical protein
MLKSVFSLVALLALLAAFLTVPAFSADPEKPDPQLAELSKKLKSKSPTEVIKTLQAIAKKGESATPLARNICDIMTVPDPTIYKAALEALAAVRPDLHDLILDAGKPDLKTHLQAIQDFGKMGKDGAPAIPLIIGDLKKVAIDRTLTPKVKGIVFQVSMDSLVNMGPKDPSVINTLVTLGGAKNREVELRSSALRNLANLTDNNPSLAKQFAPLVTSAVNDPEFRVVGLELVGKLPTETAKAILPTLTKMSNDKNEAISKAATDAIARLDAIAAAKTTPLDPKTKEMPKLLETPDAKVRDAVVDNAIAWIVRNQQPNGSWRTAWGDNRPALVVTTSFCGMSLLATGNPKFRPLVASASVFVIENLAEDKSFIKPAPQWDQTNWSVAIGGIFLCEYYAALKAADPAFKSPELDQAIEKAVSEAFRRMEDSGGWGHTPRIKNPLDYIELEIVSNWMLTMLGGAQKLGFKLDQEKLNQAINFIVNCCNPGDGGVGYSPRPGQKGFGCPNRTGGALFAFALLGKQNHALYPRMVQAWRRSQKEVPEGHGSAALGYIGSALGARQIGDTEWKNFATTNFPAIQGTSQPDGSLSFLKGTTPRSIGFDHQIGPAYNTGIYTLILLLDKGKLNFLGGRHT